MVAAWVRGRQIKRDCRLCHAQKNLKKDWACDGGEERVLYRGLGEITIDRCYLRYVDDWTVTVYRLYDHYCEGRMPVQGAVLDQPADLLDAFEIIRGAVHSAQEAI